MNNSINKQKCIQIFESIRDIPYNIPLIADEKSCDCVGKNQLLKTALEEMGLDVRWRICTFVWSEMNIPKNILEVNHDDNASHAYLEININGLWNAVDATWDKKLSPVFSIGEWDGENATEIGVQCKEIYSPEESEEIMLSLNNTNEFKKAFEEDFAINGKFYRAFNDWLENIRNGRHQTKV